MEKAAAPAARAQTAKAAATLPGRPILRPTVSVAASPARVKTITGHAPKPLSWMRLNMSSLLVFLFLLQLGFFAGHPPGAQPGGERALDEHDEHRRRRAQDH